MKNATIAALALTLSFLVGPARAQIVTWSSELLLPDGGNIRTNGVEHVGISYGSGSGDSRIINGVNFNINEPVGNHVNPSWTGFINDRNAAATRYGDPGTDIKELTNDIVYGSTLVLGIRNLTIGNRYRIQLISYDAANWWNNPEAAAARWQTIAATGDTGFDFQHGTPGPYIGIDDVGAVLVIGSWTADADSMDFTISARTPNDNAILNGFVVQDLGSAPPRTPTLIITRNPGTAGTFDFEWTSEPGKLYDLLSSIDLADPVADWPVYDDGETVYQKVPSAGEVTTLSAVPSGDSRRFFAVRESPPLFFEDFEEGNGGFTVESTGFGSAWQYGTPNAEIEGVFAIQGGNDGSSGAWGVDLTGPYAGGTVTALRSRPIDLTGLPEGTGAQLSYALAIDMGEDASLVVRVIAEESETPIGDDLQAVAVQTTEDWAEVGPFDLPAEAIGQVVRIEWIFSGPTGTPAFLGPYIDDVVLTEN